MAHQKSNFDFSNNPADKNELKFSPKNYLDFKSPLASLEIEQNLAKTDINLLSTKEDLDGSKPHCDKNELRISSKNYLSHEIPRNLTGSIVKRTTLETFSPQKISAELATKTSLVRTDSTPTVSPTGSPTVTWAAPLNENPKIANHLVSSEPRNSLYAILTNLSDQRRRREIT